MVTIVNAAPKYISSIDFDGNQKVDSRKLISIIKHKKPSLFSRSEYNPKLLSIDEILIESYYKSIGYIDIKVDSDLIVLNDSNVSINFFIIEGNRYLLDGVVLKGNYLISNEKLYKIINDSIGKFYEPPKIAEIINDIYTFYQKNGMIYSSILPREVIKGNKVIIELDIIEGSIYSIGQININTSSKEKYIFRELEFSNRDMYNIDNIKSSRKKIYATRLFSSVDISHSINSNDSLFVDMNIKTKNLKPILREFNFGISQLSTTKNDIVKPAFSSQLEWKNSNIFNSSYQLGFKTDIAANYYQDAINDIFLKMYFNVDFQGKWISKYRIPFRIMYYGEYITDFISLSRYGLRSDFTLYKDKKTKLLAIFTNESSNKKTNIFFEILFDYNTVSNHLNPISGTIFRLNPSIHGILIGGDYNYIKFIIDLRKYFSLHSNSIIALRLQMSSIIRYKNLFEISSTNSFDPPEYDLFYLGGQPSLRGWDSPADYCQCGSNDYEGGSNKALLNIELRQVIYKNFGIQLFFDAGSLTNNIINSISNISWNIGYGLSYKTPIGPITFNIGYPFAKNEPSYHFSFLYMF